MIHVKVETNADGFMNINVQGHAKTDICAVISTLMQSQVRFVQELSRDFPDQIKVTINGGTQ